MSILDNIENVNSWDKKQVAEALYWMVLGDGYLGNWKFPGRNCFLNISHKIEHREYLTWKAAILSRANIGWKAGVNNRSSSGKGTTAYLNSASHPTFRKIADRLYVPSGRKTIDSHALALLDAIGLAIIYQDDGGLSGDFVRITMTSRCQLELQAMAKVLVDKYGIIFRLQHHAKGYDLGLRHKDNDRFFGIISPYVVPVMRYKLGRGNET